MNKWTQAMVVVMGLTTGNFGVEYFREAPNYRQAVQESFNNAVGIIAYIIVIAL